MPTEPAKTDRVNLEIMGLNELRAMYRQIRDRSEARTPAIFDAAVKSSKPTPKTPLAFVRAAMVARFECRRCAGSGQFVTGTVNGKPVGPGGDCYRCGGLGTQDDADARRNYGHDRHYAGGAT